MAPPGASKGVRLVKSDCVTKWEGKKGNIGGCCVDCCRLTLMIGLWDISNVAPFRWDLGLFSRREKALCLFKAGLTAKMQDGGMQHGIRHSPASFLYNFHLLALSVCLSWLLPTLPSNVIKLASDGTSPPRHYIILRNNYWHSSTCVKLSSMSSLGCQSTCNEEGRKEDLSLWGWSWRNVLTNTSKACGLWGSSKMQPPSLDSNYCPILCAVGQSNFV